jgi:hypothetical protein
LEAIVDGKVTITLEAYSDLQQKDVKVFDAERKQVIAKHVSRRQMKTILNCYIHQLSNLREGVFMLGASLKVSSGMTSTSQSTFIHVVVGH